MAAAHGEAVDRLAASAPTLVHGDFYASNVVVAHPSSVSGAARVGVVDWELAGTGPAMLDLAALVAGGWTPDERYALATAYHEELARAADPLPELVRLLDMASLHLALQWTGRVSEWVPPPEHRRDWFDDATVALARLEKGTE
jgi:Ser/Thr protein kinase RdoA (MazF antagonist)